MNSPQAPVVDEARALLRTAAGVTEAFLDGVEGRHPDAIADERLSGYLERSGSEDGASGLAALSVLILLMWSEVNGRPAVDLLADVMRRLGGGDEPTAGVREPRRPAPTHGSGHAGR